jgi:hypothetical protein
MLRSDFDKRRSCTLDTAAKAASETTLACHLILGACIGIPVFYSGVYSKTALVNRYILYHMVLAYNFTLISDPDLPTPYDSPQSW